MNRSAIVASVIVMLHFADTAALASPAALGSGMLNRLDQPGVGVQAVNLQVGQCSPWRPDGICRIRLCRTSEYLAPSWQRTCPLPTRPVLPRQPLPGF
jgi:hypothetical protein